MSKKSGNAEPEITSEAALEFIRKMQKAFPKMPRTQAEKERLQKYLAQFTDRELKAVGRRVQGDLMLRPPRTIDPKDFRKPEPKGKARPRASPRSLDADRAPKRGDRGRR